ncbi:oxidoreductase [Natrinema saccharevitans]|uniref:Oxidoreductase n=1 Tax=Natrinema saccharevitans TaxID=301967 RepID=A0A1S8AVF3_9EURY|nr:FAD-dependent oxidoreductase [Natrinema saccharevitans]OLZ40898.1 oxidoreductase [Natrinema saccharevitans]
MDGTPVTVASVSEVGPDTVALELETPEGFDARPGQFVLLRAAPEDEEIARHYTLSSPSVGETFELTVGIDPEGDLSPWLAGLEGGETVHVEGPFGRIAYDDDDGDVVAAAGGPGIGAGIAVAEAARGAGHDATVIYQADEPAHSDRLEALSAAGATVVFVDDGATEELADAVATHRENGQLYAFGFDGFVTAVADAIEAAGGDPDDALIENFG